MIKPVFKIELPVGRSPADASQITQSLQGSELSKEYHIVVISGNSDYINMEIITAPDIKLHLNEKASNI